MSENTRPLRRWRAPFRALLIAAAVPFAGCELGITEAPTPDTVVQLEAAPPTAPADGASLVVITAQVDTTASPAIAEVKFATSLGAFAGGGAAVTAPVDAEGRARVQLKAPADTGTAIVTATAAGRTRTLLVTFTTPASSLTSVSASPSTLPADGASTTLVTAQVNPAALPAVREVKFTTTLGVFPGNVTSVTVPVDASGMARAQLRAPADSGTAIVTATAAGQTRTLLVAFTAPVNGLTAVSASPSTVPADGASTTLVTAQVNLAAVPAVREVKFTTTLGAFPGNVTSVTVPVDASGMARVQLRAPADSGSAIVTATAGAATRTIVVGFVPAPPTRLELTADAFVLAAGLARSVQLTATPLRSVGSPSPGTVVTFSADTVGGSGGGFGQFSVRSVLVRSGSATSRFSAGETGYRGRVIIRATATLAGQSVSDSTLVTITNPPP